MTELTSVLRAYAERWPGEDEVVDRFLRFIEKEPDAYERSCVPGHLTGAALVVPPSLDAVLLTHHRKLDKWLQLGGHADGDPDILRVALREAREESSLESIRSVSTDIFDVDIHVIPARGSEPEHRHYDVRFLFEADRNEPLTVSAESRSLAWIPLTEVARLNPEQSVTRMVGKTDIIAA